MKIRKPVFAGSFYPADKNTLNKTIDTYLKEAESKSERLPTHIFGIIAPHAGYEYSGGVASYAYSQLKGKEYKTVILLGPSHQIPFMGISIYPSGLWETPLGRVQIDQDIARSLTEKCKSIKPFSPAFEREHSLEVQLPFLQKTLKSFKIVPLVMGNLDENDYKALSEVLFALLKQNPKKFLIVASSDMSHYHSYNKAYRMDNLALKDIEELNVERLIGHLSKGQCELCGSQGVIVLMMLAKMLGAEVKVLNYANSGDVTGDKDGVVGYGTVAFSYPENDRALNKKEQNILLTIARKTLEEYISKGNIPQFEIKDNKLLKKGGALRFDNEREDIPEGQEAKIFDQFSSYRWWKAAYKRM